MKPYKNTDILKYLKLFGDFCLAHSTCLDPSDHKLYKFGKLYRARQVLRSLMTDRNTIDEHS